MAASTEPNNHGSDEDLPSDFFDDFNKADFMDGLSVIDSWDEDAGKKRPNRINAEKLDSVHDLRELIDNKDQKDFTDNENRISKTNHDDFRRDSPDLRSSVVHKKKRDSRSQRSNSQTRIDDYIKPGSRRDPNKTHEAIMKDKEVKVKEYLAKTLDDDLRPPGTELDDFLDDKKSLKISVSQKEEDKQQEERKDQVPTKNISKQTQKRDLKYDDKRRSKYDNSKEYAERSSIDHDRHFSRGKHDLNDFDDGTHDFDHGRYDFDHGRHDFKRRRSEFKHGRQEFDQDRHVFTSNKHVGGNPYVWRREHQGRPRPPVERLSPISPPRDMVRLHYRHRSPFDSPTRSPRWSPRHDISRRHRSPERSRQRSRRMSRSPRRSSHSPRRHRSRSPIQRHPRYVRRSPSADKYLYADRPQDYLHPGPPQTNLPEYATPTNYAANIPNFTYPQTPGYGGPASYGQYPVQQSAPPMYPPQPVSVPQPVPAPAIDSALSLPTISPVSNSIPPNSSPHEEPRQTPYDALAQLVADGKLSKEDYMKLAPNKGAPTGMDTKARVEVLSRCQESLLRLGKLQLPNRLIMNSSLIGPEPKYLVQKFCSPLKRQAAIEFHFMKRNIGEHNNKQLIDSIMTTMGITEMVPKQKKKTKANMKDAAVQTTKPYCDICEIRESTRLYDVGTAVDHDQFCSTVHTQVVEQDLVSSKSMFNPTGSVGDSGPISIAHMTPAQLVSQLAARAKTLQQPQSSEPGPPSGYNRRNNYDYEYDDRGGSGYRSNYGNYRY